MKRYIYILFLVVFLLSLTINVSALAQFTTELVGEGTVPIQDPTTLLLIGMGLLGLAGVNRNKAKR
jgi:hypothetical protein